MTDAVEQALLADEVLSGKAHMRLERSFLKNEASERAAAREHCEQVLGYIAIGHNEYEKALDCLEQVRTAIIMAQGHMSKAKFHSTSQKGRQKTLVEE